MSTRSYICKLGENLEFTYCHFDGYFTGVGKTLLEKCPDSKSVELFFSKCGEGVSTIEDAFKNEESKPNITREVKGFLREVSRNPCIEFIYIWIPLEYKEFKKNFNEEDKTFEVNLNEEDVKNGGFWYGCSNVARFWGKLNTLVEGSELLEKYKFREFIEKYSIWADFELKKNFVYTAILEGFEEAKKVLPSSLQWKFQEWLNGI